MKWILEYWWLPLILAACGALVWVVGVKVPQAELAYGQRVRAHREARCAMLLGAAKTGVDTIAVLREHEECP